MQKQVVDKNSIGYKIGAAFAILCACAFAAVVITLVYKLILWLWGL